jgi:hypothetical protein
MINQIKKTGIEFMVDLFESTRKKSFKEIVIPRELYPYVNKLYTLYEQPVELIKRNGILIPAKKNKSNKALFSLSGGKDSLSVLLKNKKRFEPNVECFYIKNISPLYNKEISNAINLSKKLEIKLNLLNFFDFIDDNKTWLPESVIKNQMIYAMVLENYSELPLAIGFGGTRKIGPQSMAFYHDSPDAFGKFYEYAKIAWGDHELVPFVEDEVESYTIINKNCSEGIFNLLASCMCKPEEKLKVRKEIISRFNIMLTNNYDCGRCYKCAEKIIIHSNFFGRKYPESYLKFCMEVLKDKVNSPYNMNGVPIEYLKKLGIN